jgi:hypothetical protein
MLRLKLLYMTHSATKLVFTFAEHTVNSVVIQNLYQMALLY